MIMRRFWPAKLQAGKKQILRAAAKKTAQGQTGRANILVALEAERWQ